MDESNETQLPLAPFSLTLDDELQYRCAGFIQAEIERYAEFIDESEGPRSHHSEGSEEVSDVGEGDNATTPTKARRPKKIHKTSMCELHAAQKVPHFDSAKLDSRDLLEREYIFIDVVSTFLRAIRAGAIRIQHGAVVLAHYGRLEAAFDTCSKIIVDALREESIMKNNPELVASVIIQAVQEVCLPTNPYLSSRFLTSR